ncbi:MAG: hypothetical protein F3745_06170 [Nitrospinae bacterium]|nr:hypothetical protein [Nitrospinota bacterium]
MIRVLLHEVTIKSEIIRTMMFKKILDRILQVIERNGSVTYFTEGLQKIKDSEKEYILSRVLRL